MIRITQTERITDKDIINWFQKYKTAIRKIVNYAVHLDFANNEISFIPYDTPLFRECTKDKEKIILAELNQIRRKIEKAEKQIEDIAEQYNAGCLIKTVDYCLSLVSEREAFVLFLAYIQHDYEWTGWVERKKHPAQKFRTLSYAEIAERVSCSKRGAKKIADRAIEKILSVINSN